MTLNTAKHVRGLATKFLSYIYLWHYFSCHLRCFLHCLQLWEPCFYIMSKKLNWHSTTAYILRIFFIQAVDHWDSLFTSMLTPCEKSTPPHVNGVHRAIFEIVRAPLWQLFAEARFNPQPVVSKVVAILWAGNTFPNCFTISLQHGFRNSAQFLIYSSKSYTPKPHWLLSNFWNQKRCFRMHRPQKVHMIFYSH